MAAFTTSTYFSASDAESISFFQPVTLFGRAQPPQKNGVIQLKIALASIMKAFRGFYVCICNVFRQRVFGTIETGQRKLLFADSQNKVEHGGRWNSHFSSIVASAGLEKGKITQYGVVGKAHEGSQLNTFVLGMHAIKDKSLAGGCFF